MKNRKASPIGRMLKYAWDDDKQIYFYCALYSLFAVSVPIISVALPKVI
ncbi:MAG: hypothetical protein BWX97_00394 [Firmicutes bacterium ADurb.Bin146]|nr:MAG: hypothetical protein BWX97_00394 [Firmicutes bacterium ADurb.Bin146]